MGQIGCVSRLCRMTISLTRLDPAGQDRAALIDFMTLGNDFPFHVRVHPSAGDVEGAIGKGAYRGTRRTTTGSWIDHRELGRIGFLRFERT